MAKIRDLLDDVVVYVYRRRSPSGCLKTVMYVGKTADISARCRAHIRDWKLEHPDAKNWEVEIIRAPETADKGEWATDKEKMLIQELRPLLNCVHNWGAIVDPKDSYEGDQATERMEKPWLWRRKANGAWYRVDPVHEWPHLYERVFDKRGNGYTRPIDGKNPLFVDPRHAV